MVVRGWVFPHSSPNLRGAQHPSRALPSLDPRGAGLLGPAPPSRPKEVWPPGHAPARCPARRAPRSRDRDGPAHLPPRDARPHSCRRALSGGRSPRVRGAHACSACLSARNADLPAALGPPAPRRPRPSRPANGRGRGHVRGARYAGRGGAAAGSWRRGTGTHVLPGGRRGWRRWGSGRAGAQGSCVKAVPLHVQGRHGSR